MLIHYDAYGKRRQKSLGRISEEEARRLREKRGEVVDDADVRVLLRGQLPRAVGQQGSDETPVEGEEVVEGHSEAQDAGDGGQIDPELAALLEVYRQSMRDLRRHVRGRRIGDQVYPELAALLKVYRQSMRDLSRAISRSDGEGPPA